MNHRTLQKAKTKAKIQHAARKLFSNVGYDVSMREIAKEAGIAVGTLFVHFHDKQDLLIQVLHVDLNKAGQKALQAISPQNTVLNNLLHATKPIYAYYLKNPRLSQVLLKGTMFLSENEENQQIKEQLQWFLGALAESIRPQFKQHAALNLESFLKTFFSLYFVTILIHIKKEKPTLSAAMQELETPLKALCVSYGLET